jgi:hypothetical protein
MEVAMSMIFYTFLLGCFDSAQIFEGIVEHTQAVESSSEEVTMEVEEKPAVNFKVDRIEEYVVEHIYQELPTWVYAANDGINLRNRATANSSVLAKIPLGGKIEILAKDKEETLGTRTDHWYHVRITSKGKPIEGYLFGSTLTPHSLRADWDGDGKNEYLFVMFNERKELLVRISDSNGENTWSNMSAYIQGEYVVERLTVKLLHKEIAGLPLLKIEASNADQTFLWTKYVSYHHGKLLRALEFSEEESELTYSKKEPKFGPKKLSMQVVEGVVQADGSEKQSIVTKRYRYRSGVFHEKNVSEPKQKILPPQVTN